MYTVYIIQSLKDQSYYVGMTSDLQERLSYHNQGKVTSTRNKIPWKVAYTEEFPTILEARTRECYLKTAAGRRFRKKLWGHSSAG